MEVYDRIKELVEMMKDFDLTEIEIKDGEQEIKLRKGMGLPEKEFIALPQGNPAALPLPPHPAAAGTPEPAAAPDAPPARDPNLFEFKAPIVGSFYRAPSPESPPYVTEGDRVTHDAILCIIEAMKVMNEIKSERSGEVVEILVENGEAVEYGQPLFLIRLDS